MSDGLHDDEQLLKRLQDPVSQEAAEDVQIMKPSEKLLGCEMRAETSTFI